MPTSTAIYASDYGRYIDQGMAPEQFRYRFLSEGDSWMERSSVFTPSLPDYLAREMDAHHEDSLILNLAMFGDTMRRIGEVVDGAFAYWIHQMDYDAILLSAGGNDFIDAARGPGPGQGILKDMRQQALPAQGRDCIRADAVEQLVRDYLDPNFARLYDVVRNSASNAQTPIFLNCYDTPVARNAPAPPFSRAWLSTAYQANGIVPALWGDLTTALFDRVGLAVQGWARGRQGVYLVPTRGVLDPADPASTASSHDWLNEIHPNASGWEKLAPVWRQAILAQLP